MNEVIGLTDPDLHRVECPYCGESVEIVLEQDVDGEMVWDCEVCCRPWQLAVRRHGREREVIARTLQG